MTPDEPYAEVSIDAHDPRPGTPAPLVPCAEEQRMVRILIGRALVRALERGDAQQFDRLIVMREEWS